MIRVANENAAIEAAFSFAVILSAAKDLLLTLRSLGKRRFFAACYPGDR